MDSANKEQRSTSLMVWVRLARVPFLTASIVPVALGTTIAWVSYGIFNLAFFVLTLIGGICLHLGTNIINDYFDYKSGCDTINAEGLSPISGGSRVLVDGLVKPQAAYIGALSFFGIAGLVGAALSVLVGWEILLLGLIGVVSGYFYVTQLATRGVGELVVGLNFGSLMVLGSYYVQTRNLALSPLIASVPVGLLIAAVLWINEIPDYAADKSVGKNTLVVRVGRKRAADLYAFIVGAAYLWTLIMVVLNQMPRGSLLVLATLPLAVKGISVARKHYEEPRSMIVANLSTIKIHMLFGALIVGGYLLDYLVRLFW